MDIMVLTELANETGTNGLKSIGLPHKKDYVKLGAIIYTKNPERYNLLGIGTCLGIFFYDLKAKNFALAHTLLPKYSEGKTKMNPKMPAKYTDIGIHKMIDLLLENGSKKSDIKCKIVGGGKIFQDHFTIGKNNTESARTLLRDEHIPIVAEDVGGVNSRSILSYSKNGEIEVRKKGIIFKI
jgi:chemotaxis protein CheD